jgi:hypothetical protein
VDHDINVTREESPPESRNEQAGGADLSEGLSGVIT